MTISPTLKNLFQFTVVIGLLSFSTVGFSADNEIIYQCPEPSALQMSANKNSKYELYDLKGKLVNVQNGMDNIEIHGATNQNSVPPFAGMHLGGSLADLSLVCLYQKPKLLNTWTIVPYNGPFNLNNHCTLGGKPVHISAVNEEGTTYVEAPNCYADSADQCKLVCPK